MSERTVLLNGLNGANPLGFMAALGCVRLLSFANPETRLGWERRGKWVPAITGFDSDQDYLESLAKAARDVRPGEDLSKILGDNITVAPGTFRSFALQATLDEGWSGLAAALGCDALEDKKAKNGRIQYTKFCFITGSGHQNFLETIRLLRERTTEAHFRDALFQGMEARDKGLSMRWDPGDAKEYALQWANPGPEGVQSSWGAYRLAIESLPFFPAVPERRWLKTTGFLKDEFQWPIWRDPIGPDAIRSLVGLEIDFDGLKKGEVLQKMREVREMGIEELFRSERVRIGEGANFKVSFRPAKPVGG